MKPNTSFYGCNMQRQKPRDTEYLAQGHTAIGAVSFHCSARWLLLLPALTAPVLLQPSKSKRARVREREGEKERERGRELGGREGKY
jgi:hypothetical protein